MAIKQLTLNSLMDELDGGRVGTAFEQQLRRIIADCEDRPGDDKERRVVLTFIAKPLADDNGGLDEVKGKFHVTSVVPKLRSKVYSFKARKTKSGPMLVFNDMSDGDIKQGTIE